MAATRENPAHTPTATLVERFREVRDRTLQLARPLSVEDQQVQSMVDASPTKWHLAHTTWFFETFVLDADRPRFDADFAYLFNSYYEALGARHPRPERGLLTRPSLQKVHAYRKHVDDAVEGLLREADAARLSTLTPLVELGLQHEQQHQELLLMDAKHLLSCNPLFPAYVPVALPVAAEPTAAARWVEYPGALVEIGADDAHFAFDNETPRHRHWLDAWRLQDRLVTNGEWLQFIDDGGYRRPDLWLSDGWAAVREHGWRAPLYWLQRASDRDVFTLQGRRALAAGEPVCHVSYYEADAFARWSGRRLPTEAEWEVAAAASGAVSTAPPALHPRAAHGSGGLRQLHGELWQWTASSYVAYPRYRAPAGAIGEYNGKFMSGQMVLRGSACVTPPGHARHTYRNFYPPDARWAFTGVRLADDG